MEVIKIWRSFLKHFKQKKLDSAVIVYGVIAIYLIPYKVPLKKLPGCISLCIYSNILLHSRKSN